MILINIIKERIINRWILSYWQNGGDGVSIVDGHRHPTLMHIGQPPVANDVLHYRATTPVPTLFVANHR